MKRFSISFVAGAAVFAAATSMLQSEPLSTHGQAENAGFSSLLDMQSGRNLPIQEFEDRSLVFTTQAQT